MGGKEERSTTPALTWRQITNCKRMIAGATLTERVTGLASSDWPTGHRFSRFHNTQISTPAFLQSSALFNAFEFGLIFSAPPCSPGGGRVGHPGLLTNQAGPQPSVSKPVTTPPGGGATLCLPLHQQGLVCTKYQSRGMQATLPRHLFRLRQNAVEEITLPLLPYMQSSTL